jgi:hypothetical protein
MTIEEQGYHYAVQAFSLRRGHFTTLFAPYLTEDDANRMVVSLREKNPQIKYRVVSQHNWQFPTLV